ncbi:MAG: APC family permease [Gammaproteobacteria bacterium]
MNRTLRTLGTFSIVMITVGSVDSIRNLPATALFGSALVFFFTLAAIFFLIPCALVSAELSSAWTDEGGIYVWVKEAFGASFGFMAVWFQWIENVFWYPTMLSFIAGTIGYLISPALGDDPYFLISVIFVCFWGTTFINLMGIKQSARFASFCSLVGLIVPMALIIGLGVVWVAQGSPMQIQFDVQTMLPHLHGENVWVSLTGIMLSFSGVEIATVHVRSTRDPQRSFPMAMLYSAVIILVTLLLGSLAIAVVLPHAQISLTEGIIEAFEVFFAAYHMQWVLPLIAIILVIGGMGSLNNWVIAPTRGIHIAANDGQLPKLFRKSNRFGAPSILLIYQAIIVTLLSLVFLFMPSVNASYWLLTALASQLYMIMYVMMFAAAIWLRYSHPNVKRPFKVFGGNVGMWVVASAGMIAAIVTFIVGFFPPDGIDVGTTKHYEELLMGGLLIMCLPPLMVGMHAKKRRKRSS